MAFYRVYYHLIWATKNHAELITPAIEPSLYELIHSKATQLKGEVHALNGTETHVHLIATIPPTLALGHFAAQVKAHSAFQRNQTARGAPPFAWQPAFGAFTFDAKRLPNHVLYVERQKEHHAANQLIPILERTTESAAPKVHEYIPFYNINDDNWWNEMRALE